MFFVNKPTIPEGSIFHLFIPENEKFVFSLSAVCSNSIFLLVGCGGN